MKGPIFIEFVIIEVYIYCKVRTSKRKNGVENVLTFFILFYFNLYIYIYIYFFNLKNIKV